MSENHELRPNEHGDELPPRLRAAVEGIKRATPPAAFMHESLERFRAVGPPAPGRRGPVRRWTAWTVWTATAAAVLALAWSLRPVKQAPRAIAQSTGRATSTATPAAERSSATAVVPSYWAYRQFIRAEPEALDQVLLAQAAGSRKQGAAAPDSRFGNDGLFQEVSQ